jgi:L-aspartate oxidase
VHGRRGDDELDVLVIGSGIAGLSAAIALAGRRRVAVISKESGGGGSTLLAQGGIAAAIGQGDSTAAHALDTVLAAAGLGDPEVAEVVTSGRLRLFRRLPASASISTRDPLAGRAAMGSHGWRTPGATLPGRR